MTRTLRSIIIVASTGALATLAEASEGAMKEPAGSSGTNGELRVDSLAKRYDDERLAPFRHSRRTMQKLFGEGMRSRDWFEPAANLGDEGRLELEWWRGHKSLTLVIDGPAVRYLKAWGLDAEDEMSDGEVATAADLFALLRWLQE